MNWLRLLACLLGLAAFALAFYVYEEYIRLLGFPDGYITELGAAEKKLATVFIGLGLPLGLYLIYLGTVANRGKMRTGFIVAAGFYLLVCAGTVAVDYYLRSRLDGGVGG